MLHIGDLHVHRYSTAHKLLSTEISHMYRLTPIILLLAILTACRDAPRLGSTKEPDSSPAITQTEQVTITLAVEGSSLNSYSLLIATFEEENPTIQVRVVSPDDVAAFNENNIRAMASSFDVFPYSPNRQGDTQYLLDLRSLLDLDPQFNPSDFLPGILPPATEPVWAVPTGAAYQVTFYDKSAFDAAGLSYPELDWTTEDFLALAQALTLRENGEVIRWGYVPGQMRHPPLLATQLAGPLPAGDSLRLADPDVMAAVQWLADLFTVHQVSPWLDDYRPAERRSGGGGQSALGLINAGRAAMWHTTHVLYDEKKENVGVAAVPRDPQGLAAEPIIYGFAASRGTANPEAAWQLLHFLSRQPPQEAMFAVGPVPARRSVATANNYWEQVPDGLGPALQYTAENSATPHIPYQAANLLQEILAAHVDGGILVVEALEQRAQEAIIPAEPIDTEMVIVETLESETPTEAVHIVFRTWTGMTEAHRLLANQFQRENPTMRIQIVERDERGGGSPLDRVTSSDCFVGFAHDLTNNAFRTALLPLQPLLDVDTTLNREAFYPSVMNQLVVDGQLFGLPAGVAIPYIDYNRRLFQEAGVPEPSPDWTLADFLEVAQQLTTGEGESKQYGYANNSAYSILIRGVDQFRVQLLDDSEMVPRFDYAAAAEMVRWYADLARLYEVQPLLTNDHMSNFAQYDTLIREERVAMWPGGGARYLAIMGQPYPLIDIGVAPEPVGPGGYRTRYWVDAYFIFADSPHQAACWQWIKFLATEASAPRLPLLPGHMETAESTEYRDVVGPELAAIGRTFITTPSAENLPSLPHWTSPGFDWLISAYITVVNGQSDVMTALAEAEAKFNQYRQCLIERDGFDDVALWQSCTSEVNRTQ